MRRTIQSCCLLLTVLGVARSPALADSVPFWGAKASVPIDTPINQLKKGEFLWMGEAVTKGPVVMVVSITEQRAYLYRNGILIGATTISTGRPGHATPTGVFTVLQKQKEHRSTIYDGAPMPYMERLTWGGVALHAGGLPGYPESHGCIHLPSEFAQRLFDTSPNGMTVVIGTEATAPEPVAHPGYLSRCGLSAASRSNACRLRRLRMSVGNLRRLPAGQSASCSVKVVNAWSSIATGWRLAGRD